MTPKLATRLGGIELNGKICWKQAESRRFADLGTRIVGLIFSLILGGFRCRPSLPPQLLKLRAGDRRRETEKQKKVSRLAG